MKQNSEISFGTIHIHKQAIAQIALSAISEMEGVSLVKKNLWGQILEYLGCDAIPGIAVKIDENDDVSLEIKVRVRYGMNIPDIARHIQDTARMVIERTVEINLKDISVNIQGIEEGTR